MTSKLIAALLAASLAGGALADPPKKPLFGGHKAKPAATTDAPAADATPPAAAATPAEVAPAPPAAPVVRPADIPISTVDVPPAATTPVVPSTDVAPAVVATANAPAAPLSGVEQVRAAFAFALPVYEMMRSRHLQIEKVEAAGGPPINRLYARTTLADARTREVTTPNNDTLYASAWLDLAGGPVVLDAPPIPGRYHSAALMDLFTNNVAIVGTRSGGAGGRYLIAGPGWSGTPPPQTTVLRVPTNDAWLLVRVLVGGPDDLPVATGLIRAFAVTVPDGTPKPVATTAVPTAQPDAKTFIAVVDEALARSPLSPSTLARPELAALGLAGGRIDPASVPPETLALWDKELPGLWRETKTATGMGGTTVDGWTYPGAGIGRFGDSDDTARAHVALGGLGALPQTEAIYLTATTDAAGEPLTGAKAYTVHLPPHLPVGAFWSLTMYEQDAGGRLFFVDTPSKRFAVGDRTPDLRAERDDSYDIFVQPHAPSGERVVNWLPSPKGRFVMVFRAYLPKPALLDGTFRLPPVAVTEVIP